MTRTALTATALSTTVMLGWLVPSAAFAERTPEWIARLPAGSSLSAGLSGPLLASWGPCPSSTTECPADFDGNGVVDAADLLTLLASWSS